MNLRVSRPLQIVLGLLAVALVVVLLLAFVVFPAMGYRARRPAAAESPAPTGTVRTSLFETAVAHAAPPPTATRAPYTPYTGGEQPPGGEGAGQELPYTSTGLPWIVPVGAVSLACILFWRWRKFRLNY